MDNPSIGEANKVLRVLSSARLKYTVTVLRVGAKEPFEFQADLPPDVRWSEQRRCLVLEGHLPKEGYESRSWEIMPIEPTDVVLVEPNPAT